MHYVMYQKIMFSNAGSCFKVFGFVKFAISDFQQASARKSLNFMHQQNLHVSLFLLPV